nr:MAG TPA: hypothetical protein [Caudoviricetes sp.]
MKFYILRYIIRCKENDVISLRERMKFSLHFYGLPNITT